MCKITLLIYSIKRCLSHAYSRNLLVFVLTRVRQSYISSVKDRHGLIGLLTDRSFGEKVKISTPWGITHHFYLSTITRSSRLCFAEQLGSERSTLSGSAKIFGEDLQSLSDSWCPTRQYSKVRRAELLLPNRPPSLRLQTLNRRRSAKVARVLF